MTEPLGFNPLSQGGHALLQFLKRQFARGRAGDPDEIRFFGGLRQASAINLTHPAAELVALHRAAEAFGREESCG